MDALFQRTGSADFPRHIKMLVQAPPKAGKTTFLSTAPGVVIADLESEANGLMSIAHKNIPYVTVDHTDKLHQLLFVLRDESMRRKAAEQMGLEEIKTVGIDTMDALQKLLKKERLKSERRTQFQRDDWSWLLDQMREMINAFNSLPLNVIYTVHTTTKQDDDEKMITMPGLQGAIAEEIAGMVGYSVLMQRTREVKPDGIPYTKYSLKVEGDDKNPHLGNRASGRLPEEIEPDFKAMQEAVFAGLSIPAAPPAESITISDSAQAPPQPVAQNQGQPAPAPTAPAAPVEADDEPMNAAALQHLQKMFAEVGVTYDEEHIKSSRTMGDARAAVKMWKAIKQDASEGKGTPGKTPQTEMSEYLTAVEFVLTLDEPEAAPEPVAVEPKIDGTIEQVMAYVGDDLSRVQEAYELEGQRDKPRATLVNALVNKGAKTAAPVQTPVENKPAEPVSTTVTSESPSADNSPTEGQAVDTVKEVLGGTEVAPDGQDLPAPCEECGKPVDDGDIAMLSKSRFKRWLCVSDYISETKKSRATSA